jgi:hypothetical protein
MSRGKRRFPSTPGEASIAEKLIHFKSTGWESLVAYECWSVFFFKYYSIAFAILTGIAGGLAQESTATA